MPKIIQNNRKDKSKEKPSTSEGNKEELNSINKRQRDADHSKIKEKE